MTSCAIWLMRDLCALIPACLSQPLLSTMSIKLYSSMISCGIVDMWNFIYYGSGRALLR